MKVIFIAYYIFEFDANLFGDRKVEPLDSEFFKEMRAFQKNYGLNDEEIITRNDMERFEIGQRMFDLTYEYQSAGTAALRQAVARRYSHLSKALVSLNEVAVL